MVLTPPLSKEPTPARRSSPPRSRAGLEFGLTGKPGHAWVGAKLVVVWCGFENEKDYYSVFCIENLLLGNLRLLSSPKDEWLQGSVTVDPQLPTDIFEEYSLLNFCVLHV